MPNRISRVRDRLDELDVDALYLTSLPNIRWACGFTGSNGVLVVGSESSFFVTDGRYTDQAQSEVDGAEIHLAENGLSDHMDEEGLLDAFSRVAFQADVVSVASRDALSETFDSIEWVPAKQVLTRLVAPKEDSEIARMRSALSVTETVFEEIVEVIEGGMTERKVAAEIVYRHLKYGADSMSFDPIVASGPNAARPHARPTDRTLRQGELIVLDMGGFRDGYASDMTRTVALGNPGSRARRAYEAVLQAQRAALETAQAGMTGKELDAVAREVLEDADLGEAFSHSLGHGIGLQVHEWPRVSRKMEDELPPGTCVTIEPGVYLPDENVGVRIEDMIVLRPNGNENLTRAPKELQIL